MNQCLWTCICKPQLRESCLLLYACLPPSFSLRILSPSCKQCSFSLHEKQICEENKHIPLKEMKAGRRASMADATEIRNTSAGSRRPGLDPRGERKGAGSRLRGAVPALGCCAGKEAVVPLAGGGMVEHK